MAHLSSCASVQFCFTPSSHLRCTASDKSPSLKLRICEDVLASTTKVCMRIADKDVHVKSVRVCLKCPHARAMHVASPLVCRRPHNSKWTLIMRFADSGHLLSVRFSDTRAVVAVHVLDHCHHSLSHRGAVFLSLFLHDVRNTMDAQSIMLCTTNAPVTSNRLLRAHIVRIKCKARDSQCSRLI